jgi:prolyl oligopeptidase
MPNPDRVVQPSPNQTFNYPASHKVDIVDLYHGIEVKDPYRWLEDADAEATQAWVEAQNQVTFDFLGDIAVRTHLQKRLTQLWDYEKYGIPFKEGDRYFYFKNDGLQNQSVLYTLTSLDGEPTILLDPNQLSPDGTIALSGMAISDDGKLIAYALSTGGSDWKEWRVKSVETGEDLMDRIEWSKFSGASWTHDGQGFFYSRYDQPESGELQTVNYFQKLRYTPGRRYSNLPSSRPKGMGL